MRDNVFKVHAQFIPFFLFRTNIRYCERAFPVNEYFNISRRYSSARAGFFVQRLIIRQIICPTLFSPVPVMVFWTSVVYLKFSSPYLNLNFSSPYFKGEIKRLLGFLTLMWMSTIEADPTVLICVVTTAVLIFMTVWVINLDVFVWKLLPVLCLINCIWLYVASSDPVNKMKLLISLFIVWIDRSSVFSCWRCRCWLLDW